VILIYFNTDSADGKSSQLELPAVPFVVALDALAGRCNQFATAKTLIA